MYKRIYTLKSKGKRYRQSRLEIWYLKKFRTRSTRRLNNMQHPCLVHCVYSPQSGPTVHDGEHLLETGCGWITGFNKVPGFSQSRDCPVPSPDFSNDHTALRSAASKGGARSSIGHATKSLTPPLDLVIFI